MGKLKPIFKKKIKCHRKSSLYLELFVWKTKEGMQTASDKRLGKYSLGFHEPFRIINFTKGKQKTSRQIGALHLCGSFGIEALVHELQHACINWCREKKINPLETKSFRGFLSLDSGEELACYSIGYMASQSVRALNKHKVW